MDLSKCGFDDGDYLQKCTDCKKEYMASKGSWRCESCAVKLHQILNPKSKYIIKYDEPVRYQTVKIKKDSHCGECGWPVLFCCINGNMAVKKPYKNNDWWLYCSNKTCKTIKVKELTNLV